MLNLQELEPRVLPDAALALLYATQVVPAAMQQHMLMDQIHEREIAYMVGYVAETAPLLPSASVHQAGFAVYQAATAFAAAIPQSDTALAEYLTSETMLMYSLPPLGNETALVDALLGEMVSQQPTLDGVLQSWPIAS